MESEKIAVLIDAENVSRKNAKQIMDTMTSKGDVIIKEIFADWTKITKGRVGNKEVEKKIIEREKRIEGWRMEAAKFSMTPVQQFVYVEGKNTNDIAMSIEAMKILYEKPYVTTFCLVASDSDFTRLAQELKANNKYVYGMGERGKSIQEFVNAFSEFVYLGEDLDNDEESQATTAKPPKAQASEKTKDNIYISCPLDEEKLEAVKKLISELIDEYDGVAHYSLIYEGMKKQYSDFVPANYECKNLSQLIDKLMPFLKGFVKHKEPIPNNPNGWNMMLKRR